MNDVKVDGAPAPEERELTARERVLARVPEQFRETVGELWDKHDGNVAVYVVDSEPVVLAMPFNGDAEYKRLTNELSGKDGDKATALRTFLIASTVYPDRAKATRIYARRPAFAMKAAGRAQDLYGDDVEELGND